MAAFVTGTPILTGTNSFLLKPRKSPRESSKRYGRPRSSTVNLNPVMIKGFPNNFGNGSNTGGEGPSPIWDQLVDFPCVFTFKVIGMAQGDFANDIIDSVATALNTDRKYLKTSYRDRGKYRSITVEAPVNTAEQIYDVYAAIDRDPRVKFKF